MAWAMQRPYYKLRSRKSRCDIIGLQKVRRGGQGSFEAAGYTVYSSGSEKRGNHGVRLAVAKRIVEASGTFTPEPINERPLKVQLSLTGKWNRVTFVVAYAPTECAAYSDKTIFWSMLLETVASVPRKDQMFVLMMQMPVLAREIGVEAWNTPRC